MEQVSFDPQEEPHKVRFVSFRFKGHYHLLTICCRKPALPFAERNDNFSFFGQNFAGACHEIIQKLTIPFGIRLAAPVRKIEFDSLEFL